MQPNRFYTEWLSDEIVKLNKIVRECKHNLDQCPSEYETGYCQALVEVIKDLRGVLNEEHD